MKVMIIAPYYRKAIVGQRSKVSSKNFKNKMVLIVTSPKLIVASLEQFVTRNNQVVKRNNKVVAGHTEVVTKNDPFGARRNEVFAIMNTHAIQNLEHIARHPATLAIIYACTAQHNTATSTNKACATQC